MGDYKAIIDESHERCRKSGLDKEQVYTSVYRRAYKVYKRK